MKLQYLQAGEIVNVHGIRGEMKVLPWVDSPEFLCEFSRVRINGKDYKVELCRVQKTCNLMKLQGVNTVEEAQLLRGKTVEIYRDDISDDLIFADELIDMEVYADGVLIGKITDVLDYPGNKVYIVKGEREYMIPAVKAFILSTDLDANRMEVRLIEGMATDEN
jgi:16S rRNA processing protein RimM